MTTNTDRPKGTTLQRSPLVGGLVLVAMFRAGSTSFHFTRFWTVRFPPR